MGIIKRWIAEDASRTHGVLMVVGTILNFAISFGLVLPVIGWFGGFLVFLIIFFLMFKWTMGWLRRFDPEY